MWQKNLFWACLLLTCGLQVLTANNITTVITNSTTAGLPTNSTSALLSNASLSSNTTTVAPPSLNTTTNNNTSRTAAVPKPSAGTNKTGAAPLTSKLGDNWNETKLSVRVETKDLDSLAVIWSLGSNDSRITGFIVSYLTQNKEHYDSDVLDSTVREFEIQSIRKDENYVICVHVMVNTTDVKKECSEWNQSSMKIVVGILAGVVFLLPCVGVLVWILRKDRLMTRFMALEYAELDEVLEVKPRSESQSKESCGACADHAVPCCKTATKHGFDNHWESLDTIVETKQDCVEHSKSTNMALSPKFHMIPHLTNAALLSPNFTIPPQVTSPASPKPTTPQLVSAEHHCVGQHIVTLDVAGLAKSSSFCQSPSLNHDVSLAGKTFASIQDIHTPSSGAVVPPQSPRVVPEADVSLADDAAFENVRL
ncbi:uncharacterized protein LOC131939916 [Physella acuta]|uniref:uncharacterized protein LOC131939916 n=1 Tax=Physella acuta TaxID=109671 RepID=UPI0027DB3E12|nr:uncharacterized protein LOC131939916 [Physella acuta]XP_059154438.1 uncharacterized protein LOC131939916 [Physella acuta]